MEKQERFLMVPYKLLASCGYVSNNGERVKMTLTEKIVYSYIYNRFKFFSGLGKEYYDTQKSIALACNMDLKATGNVLRKFIKNDLTVIYKKPYGNFSKNVYTRVPPLRLWYKDEEVFEWAFDESVYDFPKDFVDTMPDIGYFPENTEENFK